MTQINHNQVMQDAEAADERLAAFIVTLWCWIAIFCAALLCVEVLL